MSNHIFVYGMVFGMIIINSSITSFSLGVLTGTLLLKNTAIVDTVINPIHLLISKFLEKNN